MPTVSRCKRRSHEEALNEVILNHHIERIKADVHDEEIQGLMIEAYRADCILATASPRQRGAATRRRNRALQALKVRRAEIIEQLTTLGKRVARLKFLDDPETIGEA